jgi:hypothetical protein
VQSLVWLQDSPTSTPSASISCLYFRYMGHTWPSKTPGGSATTYLRVLQREPGKKEQQAGHARVVSRADPGDTPKQVPVPPITPGEGDGL